MLADACARSPPARGRAAARRRAAASPFDRAARRDFVEVDVQRALRGREAVELRPPSSAQRRRRRRRAAAPRSLAERGEDLRARGARGIEAFRRGLRSAARRSGGVFTDRPAHHLRRRAAGARTAPRPAARRPTAAARRSAPPAGSIPRRGSPRRRAAAGTARRD